MKNPFETIDARLSNIENLLLDMKHSPKMIVAKHPDVEEFLTTQKAADFLGITVPTLYSKVWKREIPYMKRSKLLYFSRTDLMEYLKEGRKMSNDEIQAEAENYLKKKNKGAI